MSLGGNTIYKLYMSLRDTWIYRAAYQRLSWLRPYLLGSKVRASFDIYLVYILMIPLVSTILSLAVFLLPAIKLVGVLKGVFAALMLAILIGVFSLFVSIYHPIISYRDRGRVIEARLPLIASVISSIAASGAPPSILILHLHRIRDRLGLEKEIEFIVRRAVMGGDLPTALREASDFAPSKPLSDLLRGLAMHIEGGVGITEFLETFLRDSLTMLSLKLRNTADTLSFLMEVYVSIGIIFPLLTITLLLFLGGLGTMPFDPYIMLGSIIFVVLPAAFAILLILAYLTISGVRM